MKKWDIAPVSICERSFSHRAQIWSAQPDNDTMPPTRSTGPPSTVLSSISAGSRSSVIPARKYVSLHDAGRILNPALFDGHVRGGFAMAVGTALHERPVYGEDGGFVTGSLLDYALPTASMIP